MSNCYKHKRGDTFDLSGPVQVEDGGQAVHDFTGWSVACQLRRVSGALVADADAQWLNAQQGLMRVRCANTQAWPLGLVDIDIQMTTPSGDVLSTPTEQIEVVADVTQK